MSDKTGIEWTRGDDGAAGATWNPVTGCTKVSPGCDHCYAETFAERWRGTPGHHFENGFDVTLRPERLDQPLRWKRPRRIFTNSMSDLFHDAVPDEYIAKVFAVMAIARQHTFQVLTKRHARMRSLMSNPAFGDAMLDYIPEFPGGEKALDEQRVPWPLPNVWLGVSAEDQKWWDIRWTALRETPAAVRFVSAEPLLGGIAMGWPHPSGPDWLIIGGESGPGAREMRIEWARDLVAQCADYGIAPFVKQLGSVLGRELGAGPKGGDLSAWPEDLRVQEFPQPAEVAVTP